MSGLPASSGFRRALLVACAFVCATVASLSGAAPDEPATGTLLLSFRDSRSGAAVVPQSVLIDGAEVASEVDPFGLLSTRLSGGVHQVTVRHGKYDPFEATVRVDGEETPVNTFELDRLTSPSTSEEAPRLDPRQAVVEGYVVDSAYGSLIPGAEVQTAPRSTSARTDGEGYFALSLAVPSAHEDGPPVAERITLKVSRDGYVAEERRNVEIISGTTMTISVQLDRLTSETEPVRVIDEGAPDYRLHSWRFDVTID